MVYPKKKPVTIFRIVPGVFLVIVVFYLLTIDMTSSAILRLYSKAILS
jgi:hypothetical protein